MKSKKLIRNVLAMFAIILMSTVLCGAGCSNIADGSSGDSSGGGKGTPVIGSVVMKDGTLKKISEINAGNKVDAIAVVYKVAGGKAYAVGKVHDIKPWCIMGATAYGKKIDDLVTNVSGSAGALTFTKYQDGSDGWNLLKSTINDTGTIGNYPAWEWVNSYGTNYGGSSFVSGWYFPSVKELYEIWKQKYTVDASLKAIGGSEFGNSLYDSSSHHASTTNNYSLGLDFDIGHRYYANVAGYVCAVRQFTY